MSDLFVREEDLINNPTTRVPICLVLDTSGSMNRIVEGDYTFTGRTEFHDGQEWDLVEGGVTAIDKLNDGIRLFFDAIKEDEVARYSAEIAIVTFSDAAELLLDFGSIENQNVPEIIANGNTTMGEGVNLALDLLENRKAQYKNVGVDYYQPWMVLMTDGVPNGNENELRRAINRTVKLVNSRKLTVFPIGIGDEADMNTLQLFSPKRQPLKLKGLNFKKFFEWLSQSVIKTSQSMPGEIVKLDAEGIKGWADL